MQSVNQSLSQAEEDPNKPPHIFITSIVPPLLSSYTPHPLLLTRFTLLHFLLLSPLASSKYKCKTSDAEEENVYVSRLSAYIFSTLNIPLCVSHQCDRHRRTAAPVQRDSGTFGDVTPDER